MRILPSLLGKIRLFLCFGVPCSTAMSVALLGAVIYRLARLDGMSEPYVTADNASVTDLSIAAENGGVRIYNAVVSDVGVALDALDGITVPSSSKLFAPRVTPWYIFT